jgi:hypothetical protein
MQSMRQLLHHLWTTCVVDSSNKKKKVILEWRQPRRGVSSMNIWHVHQEEL